MKHIINVEQLSKTFIIRETFPGILGALKGLFFAGKSKSNAIDGISFAVQAGERIAFIGPNGAGKSTTIKMLTGILHPTSGLVEVLGQTPWKSRRRLGYEIGTVFGQRTQLWYHLPPIDTFALLSKIYELPPAIYKERMSDLIETFEVSPFLHKPVRQLSLGERMRCEIVASLLHQPQILFLDEPTIGLDINAKLKIRKLLNALSKEHGTTLFLTSHDTADIEQVCDRVIVLDQGTIVADSSLLELKKNYIQQKIFSAVTDKEHLSLNLPGINILKNVDYHFVCEIDLKQVSVGRIIHELLQRATLKDVVIEEPSMEETIRMLYSRSTNG